jgi:hypothetical protein
MESMEDYQRYDIDPKKFAERFSEADREIWNSTGRSPKKIYIGAEDYMALVDDENYPGSPFEFTVHLRQGAGAYFGVPVEVIPWMKGFLVV